jgi:hypothetical protein
MKDRKMSEFYSAKENETPVTVDFPTVGFYEDEPPRHMIQTRRQYYGAELTVAEIVERLLGLGYIDRSDKEEDEYSLNMLTGDPLTPGQHEFWVGETIDFGSPFGNIHNVPRVTVKVHLYFNELDMSDWDCPECSKGQDCEYDHMKGWNYEEPETILELNDGGW